MLPVVVTCITNKVRSSPAYAFCAVLIVNQDAPMMELLNKEVAPSVLKNGVIGWAASSAS